MMDKTAETYKILAIDDDFHIQSIIRMALAKKGFLVETVASAEDALNYIERKGLPHLAIVDIMLPYGIGGEQFCKIVHEYSDLPVIVLSTITDVEVIVSFLENHAEDYITKPFYPTELVARVSRVLARIGDFDYATTALRRIDDHLQIDFANKRLLNDDLPIALTPTETKLLYILLRQPTHTLTTPFILKRLWPLERASEDRLRVHIHRLRRKLERNDNPHTYIQSTRGVGYRFQPLNN